MWFFASLFLDGVVVIVVGLKDDESFYIFWRHFPVRETASAAKTQIRQNKRFGP